jgi:hypothetical protein
MQPEYNRLTTIATLPAQSARFCYRRLNRGVPFASGPTPARRTAPIRRVGTLKTIDQFELMASPGAADLAIDDNWHAELLNELREVRREIDSIPKKWELRLVAYVILGAVGSLFIFRDIIAWLFFLH